MLVGALPSSQLALRNTAAVTSWDELSQEAAGTGRTSGSCWRGQAFPGASDACPGSGPRSGSQTVLDLAFTSLGEGFGGPTARLTLLLSSWSFSIWVLLTFWARSVFAMGAVLCLVGCLAVSPAVPPR